MWSLTVLLRKKRVYSGYFIPLKNHIRRDTIYEKLPLNRHFMPDTERMMQMKGNTVLKQVYVKCTIRSTRHDKGTIRKMVCTISKE